jgi:hypothetical protein
MVLIIVLMRFERRFVGGGGPGDFGPGLPATPGDLIRFTRIRRGGSAILI